MVNSPHFARILIAPMLQKRRDPHSESQKILKTKSVPAAVGRGQGGTLAGVGDEVAYGEVLDLDIQQTIEERAVSLQGNS